MTESQSYILFRSFLQLLYSLAKQFISWYDAEIKSKVVV